MLIVNNIEVTYNSVILVLRGVSFQVQPGQVVALLGANGAGKSTTLKAISGLLSSELGEVTRGSITWQDERIDTLNTEDIVRRGLVQVIEGRPLFQHLTVEENLRVGGRSSHVGMPRAAEISGGGALRARLQPLGGEEDLLQWKRSRHREPRNP